MKLRLNVVVKEMTRARGPNGDRLFAVTEFLSAQQISSFFSSLAAKVRQKEVQVTEQDALAVRRRGQLLYRQRQSAFVPSCHSPCCGRSVRLVCLGKKQRIKKLKVGLLQVLSVTLDLQAPIPPVQRKAPYFSLLQGSVKSCSRSTMQI